MTVERLYRHIPTYQLQHEEGKMLRKLLNQIRHPGGISGLALYHMALQRGGHSRGPTIDEARRDYRAAIRAATPWYRV